MIATSRTRRPYSSGPECSNFRRHGVLHRSHRPHPLRGPRQRQPAGVPLVRRRPRRRRPADGGSPPLRRVLLALVRLGWLRHLRRRHARSAVAPDVRTDADPMAAAKQKMDAAFEFFAKLGVPFYCFHDRDIAPEGASFKESAAHLDEMVDVAAEHQQRTGVQLLWGTANLFSNPRYPGRRGHQPRPRGVRLRRRPGRPLPRGDPSARRPQLRAVGRPRGVRDVAQHRHEARARPAGPVPVRWSSSTSTRSGSPGRS